MQTYKIPNPTADGESMRAERRILRKMETLLETRFLETITVRELCMECRISTRTFYNYFPDKESVVWSIYQNMLVQFRSQENQPASLRNYIQQHYAFLLEHRIFFIHCLRQYGPGSLWEKMKKEAQQDWESRIARMHSPTQEERAAVYFFLDGCLGLLLELLYGQLEKELPQPFPFLETCVPEILKPYLD